MDWGGGNCRCFGSGVSVGRGDLLMGRWVTLFIRWNSSDDRQGFCLLIFNYDELVYGE